MLNTHEVTLFIEMISILFTLKGTVISKIWWKVLLIAFYTGLLVVIRRFMHPQESQHKLINLKGSPINILGILAGFLLVFRTNKAYAVYWEGRKLWSSISLNIRAITRVIWVRISAHEVSRPTVYNNKYVVKLAVGFAYAVKNHLRGVDSREDIHVKRLLEGHTNPDMVLNAPLEISLLILDQIKTIRNGQGTGGIGGYVNKLMEAFGGLEKLRTTPLPKAYSVHLYHLMTIYFLLLPVQLSQALGWYTIPVVAFAAFGILGVLAVGEEIANPFGTDYNDLPLEEFCAAISEEADLRMKHFIPVPNDWIFSDKNYPFFDASILPASMLVKYEEIEIRNILQKFARK